MPATPLRIPPPFRPCTAAALALIPLLSACTAQREAYAHRRLDEMLLRERATVGRLAGQRAWQPCVDADATAPVPRTRCGEAPAPGTRRFRRLAAATRRAGGIADDGTRAGRVTRARLGLLWRESSPAGVAAAVATLEEAHRAAPGDAALLNDLAVAWLARAEQTGELTPALRALDAVERAVALDPEAVEARFNRALVMDRLHLVASAQRAWAAYLAAEPDPDWRREADLRRQRLARMAGTTGWDDLLHPRPTPLDSAARSEVAARVARSGHGAREFAFTVLGGWGRARASGDTAEAHRLLDLARALADGFRVADGDLGIPRAVAVIERADGAHAPGLATAHASLGEGMERFRAGDMAPAATVLASAEASLRAAGSPLAGWADYYRGAADVNLGRYAEAARRFHAVAARADPRGDPALAGRATWALGTIQVRRGNPDSAIHYYRRASVLVAAARERENEGSVAYLLSEARYLAGQTVPGALDALRGLRLLAPYRRSTFLNNQLTTVAVYARGEGLHHAALAVMDEVLAVAPGTGKHELIAWAHRARARDLAMLGRAAEARSDLAAAVAAAARVPDDSYRDRVRADVILARGQIARTGDPRAARILLDSALALYRRVDLEVHMPLALYESALAARGTGDHSVARARLDEAVLRIETSQAAFISAEVRASYLETVENVFDEVIRLSLDGGDAEAAFAYLERGRVALRPGHAPAASSASRADLRRIGRRLAPGVLLVEYALLPDRVVAWTVRRGGWGYREIRISRDSVAALVGRASGGLAGDAARRQLFALLVAPLGDARSGVRRMVIVPDRELHALSFASLVDGATGRHLVEDHLIAMVPSAGFYLAAAAGPRRTARPGGLPLVVGDPAIPAAEMRLDRLPGAAREAEAVARLYPGAPLLMRDAARRRRVLELLPGASLLHFAGHAVSNGGQPEQSYLALAPEPAGAGAELRAWEIADLRLSNLQVVILSACSTLGPRPSRAGAATGLAHSFLRAGAPALVSTLWDIDDGPTTELLVEFHRRLAAGAEPIQALRQTQLLALKSPRPELRDPRVWAAFIYTGA